MALKQKDGDLITVQEFAEKFRVDASVVRGWVKQGLIDYVLVGPRNMRCVRRSDILKPIKPKTPAHVPTPAAVPEVETLTQLLMASGMDLESARGVAGSMELADMKQMISEMGGTSGTN